MNQSEYGEYPMSLLDRRGDQRCTIAGRPRAVSTASLLSLGHAPYGSPLWALPGVTFTGRAPRRRYKQHTSLLMVISRIVTAIRLWRVHAPSRQQLRALGDHLLKDIGLRREGLGCEFLKPFRPCD